MAIDFDKIRNKLAKISGQGNSATWRPEAGKNYCLRIMPWPDGNDGQPFKERQFYYNIGGGRAILAPVQFGKQDPIQDLIRKLQSEGTAEAQEMCKQFYPKRRYYAPIIVRGEWDMQKQEIKGSSMEDKGPKLWGFGKMICQSILQDMVGEAGDITDVKEGRDLIVTCVQEPGSPWTKTEAKPRFSTSKLSTDAKTVKEWMKNIPDLDELYTELSTEEIEKRVEDHLNGASSSDGTERTPAKKESADADATSEDAPNIEDAFEKLSKLSGNK